MAKQPNWWGVGFAAIVFLILGLAAGSYAFPQIKTETVTEYEVPQETLDFIDSLQSQISNYQDTVSELNDRIDYLEDEYEDYIDEDNIEAAAREWVLENYIEELDLDDDDYEDYTFDVDFEEIEVDEKSNDDWEVNVEGIIEFYDEDDYLVDEEPFEAELEFEEDGDLDDAEIEWA